MDPAEMNTTEEAPLNYFNYFTEIEETFVRRRGKNLLLSPLDWAMIESWQERGIPLHIVIRAVENVFDVFDRNPRPRTIKGLMYCREEVEAQYTEWLKMRAGKEVDEKPAEDGLSTEAIAEHINSAIALLGQKQTREMREFYDRAAVRLKELLNSLNQDLAIIDNSLLDIEKFLDQALLTNYDREHLSIIEAELAGQLAGYRSGMEEEAYRSTFEIMLLKRLRENEDLPRLGLFNL